MKYFWFKFVCKIFKMLILILEVMRFGKDYYLVNEWIIKVGFNYIRGKDIFEIGNIYKLI